ncbi:MAG: nitroreductase family protein [Anaerolineae bacterium]|nr:nitroreductase family protein [Anaerolineae bacterium]MDW8098294.1 nitroreductase family protein [Anaerolineae bacterium]
MDARLSFIFARRSIREYTTEPLSDADVQALLEAGMAAPSASNIKPWHFIVVRRRETLNRLAKAHQFADPLERAPLGLVVCGIPAASAYWEQDTSAATENILLAATALGLGAVWIGIHPNPDRVAYVRHVLGIPDEIVPLNLIAIGHPAEEKPARTQFDPSRVHYERF